MPDDCLIEIFSMKSFDLMDMCSIADTCKRFRTIIQRIIGKTICFKGERYCSFTSKRFVYRTDKRSDIESIFRNFGSCFSTVFVFAEDEQQECFLLNLIVVHCGEKLKSLCILHLRITATLAKDLKPIFKQLNTLSLSSVSIEGSWSTFTELDSVVDLDVSRVKNCSTILDNFYPKLQQFTYQKDTIKPAENCSDPEEYQDRQSLETISIFIKRHPTLKSLDIDFECDHNCWTVILQAIGNSCKKLQKLTIGTGCDRQMFSSDFLQPLQALTLLRIVKLTAVSFEDFCVFANLPELRELELQHCILPQTKDHFAYLAQLTNLSLIESKTMSGSFDMADIVSRLVNLTQFLALQWFTLDTTTLWKIVDIVKGRSNVLTLVCKSTVHCGEEAFQKSNGRIVVRAEDRYVSTCSFR